MKKKRLGLGVVQVRRYRYDNEKISMYCIIEPFYQNHDNGIKIPMTAKLITTYFHFRRKHGPEDTQAMFKLITDDLITEVNVFNPSR